MVDVSVIVPAYLQENNIVEDLSTIYKELRKLPYETELICVVDGSTDNTFQKAKHFARYKRNVQVVQYKTNKGKGHAIKVGMRKSKGKIVGFIDAGGDINPSGLALMLDYFHWFDADAVIGSKRHPESKVKYPWQRRILSFYYQQLVKILFGLNVRDTQVGMKFYKRKLVKLVLPLVTSKRYAFDIELLALAHYFGFTRIYEAPAEVTLDFGGKSVITGRRLIKTISVMIYDTFKIYYKLHFKKAYADRV